MDHNIEKYSFGSSLRERNTPPSRCVVTSWSPPVPFRTSSVSNRLRHNKHQHQLYSTTTATSSNTATSTTNPDNVHSNFDGVVEQQQQERYHDGSSSTKRISKAASISTATTPHQSHDRTMSSSTVTSTTSTTTNPSRHVGTRIAQEYDISLRLATLSDIASISSCNIQTLPENYNDMFYMNHINEYPYLSLVAVIDAPTTTSFTDEDEAHQMRQRRMHGNYEPTHPEQPPLGFIQRHLQMSKRRFATSFWTPQQQYNNIDNHNRNRDEYNSHTTTGHESHTAATTNSKSIVVGYLLGKITAPQEPYQYVNYQKFSLNNIDGNHQRRLYRSEPSHEMIGHVSSLAVLPEARRRGLARALLEQFHHHLSTTTTMQRSSSSLNNQRNHPNQNDRIAITSTGLHVRRSNVVAVKLYETLGYIPAVTIPSYYEDGEDAYYMQKVFERQHDERVAQDGQRQHQPQLDRVSKQEANEGYMGVHSKDDYQLPRVINVLSLPENEIDKQDGTNSSDDPHSESNQSNDNHVHIHVEEEEEEQMLMNGSL